MTYPKQTPRPYFTKPELGTINLVFILRVVTLVPRLMVMVPDFGFVENTRARLAGDVRPQQPDPLDGSTWRDSWLETAILEAISTEW